MRSQIGEDLVQRQFNINLRTELVVDALEMALWNGRPAAGLIHHSDHGCQYTSLAFGRRCRKAGSAASIGIRGLLLR